MNYEDIKLFQTDIKENDRKSVTFSREFFDNLVDFVDKQQSEKEAMITYIECLKQECDKWHKSVELEAEKVGKLRASLEKRGSQCDEFEKLVKKALTCCDDKDAQIDRLFEVVEDWKKAYEGARRLAYEEIKLTLKGKRMVKTMSNKLTPEEIKKALECCTPENESCLNCPLINISVPECAGILYKETLDLINRQQAEIERLEKENLILSQKRVNLFERVEIVNNARVKTIKEVEKVVDKTFSGIGTCGYNYVRHKIHCILKEMVGEDK